ncbi:MAG TPA: prepilin-type N-terminal cleavage/methylation domain-containing protein [bacterium]|nr:prepilin-type N-terminal cleavage/methylation domain-containing protein [bacterium]
MIGRLWRRGTAQAGFTFVEMLLVLALMGLLASLVGAVASVELRRSKESALKQDLRVLRKALDEYRADKGRYPAELGDLVGQHYLRQVPQDPLTGGTDTWREDRLAGLEGGIEDIHSGSEEVSSDGDHYSDW